MFRKRMLYKEYIIEWLSNKKEYVKESTYASYANNVYNHIIPLLGKYHMYQINNKLIQDFLLELYKNGRSDGTGGLSIKTIKDIIIIVKSSIRKAINDELVKPFEITLTYPKNNKESKIFVLTKHEQNKLTDFLVDNICNKNIGLLLSLYSGLRIGEVCSLQWKDVDLKRNMLSINKTIQRVYIKDKDVSNTKIIISSPKTRNANRDIPLNKDLIELIKSFKTNNEDYIVSGKSKYIEPRSYRRYFNKVLKKNKIKHYNFHSLRHTFATNCISLGVDYKTVSELLGHSNVNITLNLYVHPRLSQKRKCMDKVCKALQNR